MIEKIYIEIVLQSINNLNLFILMLFNLLNNVTSEHNWVYKFTKHL